MKELQFERTIPELLVPASGMRELFAAVENGADAVYLGGKLFNARKNAKNFNDEELTQAVRVAHAHDVKIYVTTNILLYDEELQDALEYAKFLYEIGVDALIIQDLGFAGMIRKYIPDFEIHLSTQASVYNLNGILKAKELGFSRVVLARENTLAEIKEITEKTDLEIEVFVHGAICICYSGQCQFSNSIGNRSGNRGECAQPCRMKFNTTNGNTHALSPKDMSAIQYLKEISEAGVKSIKIEGRMKSAEYVAIVCSLYRKYLDQYRANGDYKVSEDDLLALAQIFNRGNFTDGYFFGNQGEDFMSKRIPKHQGIYIGVALGKVSDTLVDVKLEKGHELNIGDGVEFLNGELSGNVLSYVKPGKDKQSLRIGDIRGDVNKRDLLYKISDKRQLAAAAETISRLERGKSLRKTKVDMAIEIKKDDMPTLKLTSGNTKVVLKGNLNAEEAIKVPLTCETVKKQLSKLGSTPFEIGDFVCKLESNISLPISALNELRREAISQLEEKKVGKRQLVNFNIHKINLNKLSTTCFVDFRAGIQKYSEKVLEIYFHELNEKSCKICEIICQQINNEGRVYRLKIVIPIWDFIEKKPEVQEILFKLKAEKRETVAIPYIFPITTGKYDKYIDEHMCEILDISAENGIYVGNLGTLNLFKNTDIQVFADYGMNIINGEAIKNAYDMNLAGVFLGHEINHNVFGKIPLMISEHKFIEKEIVDKKRQKYIIEFLNYANKSIIYKKVENSEDSTFSCENPYSRIYI